MKNYGYDLKPGEHFLGDGGEGVMVETYDLNGKTPEHIRSIREGIYQTLPQGASVEEIDNKIIVKIPKGRNR